MSGPGHKPTTSGATARSKFQTVNLNSVYSGKSLLPNKSSGPGAKHGLQSLGKQTAVQRRMPPPANLPSLRSESCVVSSSITAETNVNLVPSGTQRWATQQPSQDPDNANNAQQQHKQTTGGESGAVHGAGRRWRSNDGGAAAFFSSQSHRDFPTLGNADSKASDSGPSLKPQKCGSWKSGGGSKMVQQDDDEEGQHDAAHDAQDTLQHGNVPYNMPRYMTAYGPPPPQFAGYPPAPPGGYHQPPPNYRPPSNGPPPGPPHYPPQPYGRGRGPPPPMHYDHPPQHMYTDQRYTNTNMGRPPYDYPGYGDGPYEHDRGYPPPPQRAQGPSGYPPPPQRNGDGLDESGQHYAERYPTSRYTEQQNDSKRVVWSDDEEERNEERPNSRRIQPHPPPQEYGPPAPEWEPEAGGEPCYMGPPQYDRRPAMMPPHPQMGYPPMGPPPPGAHPREQPYQPEWYPPPRHPYPPPPDTPPVMQQAPPRDYYSEPSSPRPPPLVEREVVDIEAEEKEEQKRQRIQNQEREAAIERSRMKRRLGQQGSAASSTGNSSELTGELNRQVEGVSDADVSENERPCSNDSAQKNVMMPRRNGGGNMPGLGPRFNRGQVPENKYEYSGSSMDRRSKGDHRAAYDRKGDRSKYDADKPSRKQANKEKPVDYKVLKRPDSKESASGSDRSVKNQRPARNGTYNENYAGETNEYGVKQDYAKPLTLDEDEEEEEMQPLSKLPSKLVKRTTGGGSQKKEEKKEREKEEMKMADKKNKKDKLQTAPAPEENVWEQRLKEREKESQDKEAKKFFEDRRRPTNQNEEKSAWDEDGGTDDRKWDRQNQRFGEATRGHRGKSREFYSSSTVRRGRGSTSSYRAGLSTRGSRRGSSLPGAGPRRYNNMDNEYNKNFEATPAVEEEAANNGNNEEETGEAGANQANANGDRRGRGAAGARGRGRHRLDPGGLMQLNYMMSTMYPSGYLSTIQPPRRYTRGRGGRPAPYSSGRGTRDRKDARYSDRDKAKEGENVTSGDNETQSQESKNRGHKRPLSNRHGGRGSSYAANSTSWRHRSKESNERGAQAKSPTQSEGIDEWETASESSDVGDRRTENINAKKVNGAPARFSAQRRDRDRVNWGPNSGNNRKDDRKDEGNNKTASKNSQPASHHQNKKHGQGSTDRGSVGKLGALAGLDMNDARLVIIDHHPDHQVSETALAEFVPVLSKKEKRLRYQQMLKDEQTQQRKARKLKEEKAAKKVEPVAKSNGGASAKTNSSQRKGQGLLETPPDAYFTSGNVVDSVFGSTWSRDVPTTPTIAPIGPPASKHKKAATDATPGGFQSSFFEASPNELSSKTGVEIWGTPDPMPFTVHNKETKENNEGVDRPAPSKSVEFPADMAYSVSKEQNQFDFTFDPTLPTLAPPPAASSTNEPTSTTVVEPRTKSASPRQQRHPAPPMATFREEGEQKQLKQRLEGVRAVWNLETHNKENDNQCRIREDIVCSAASQVSAALLGGAPDHYHGANDGPLVAKVRPQQLQPCHSPVICSHHSPNMFVDNSLKFASYSPLNSSVTTVASNLNIIGQASSPPMLTPTGVHTSALFSMPTQMPYNPRTSGPPHFTQPPPMQQSMQQNMQQSMQQGININAHTTHWNMNSPFAPGTIVPPDPMAGHNAMNLLTSQFGAVRGHAYVNGGKGALAPAAMAYQPQSAPAWLMEQGPGAGPTPQSAQGPPAQTINLPMPPNLSQPPPPILGAIGSQRPMTPQNAGFTANVVLGASRMPAPMAGAHPAPQPTPPMMQQKQPPQVSNAQPLNLVVSEAHLQGMNPLLNVGGRMHIVHGMKMGPPQMGPPSMGHPSMQHMQAAQNLAVLQQPQHRPHMRKGVNMVRGNTPLGDGGGSVHSRSRTSSFEAGNRRTSAEGETLMHQIDELIKDDQTNNEEKQ